MQPSKLVLSLSVITTLSISTSAFAFNGTTLSLDAQQNITYIKNKPLEEKAHEFIDNLMQEGVGILKNNDSSEKARTKGFEQLLKNNFDMKTIGKFALGRYWKTSSKSEQKEYLKLFEAMIVRIYSGRFSDYNGQKIEVTSSRPEGKHDAMVSSLIIPESGPEIDVDWRVRKKKNGSLKVIDIMVEGVSMSLTQRSDFSSVIQRGGGKIEVLLKHLRH